MTDITPPPEPVQRRRPVVRASGHPDRKTMITALSRAKALYPEAGEHTYFDTPCDYDPIIRSFGEVLVQVDDGDYSGDTRVFLRKNGRYGFLSYGWGSCTGCDALQSCGSYQEIDELIDSLENNIKWFDTLAEAQAYVANDEERQGSYYYHEEEWAEFKAAVAEVAA
jgi:hypothetical protein